MSSMKQKEDFLIEACVDSLESVIEAAVGRTDRLELCSNLMIGGTSPSVALFNQVKELLMLPVHVLIRPRTGDFCYSKCEYQTMLEEIKMFKMLGADGVVIGILEEGGSLDKARMKDLVEQAEWMKVTLHRAFDMCKDPLKTLEDAIELGIDIILTSGQQENCVKGSRLIKELVRLGGDRIRIMAGGGMHESVAGQMYRDTGVRDFHLSGKVVQDSKMKYRKKEVSMGLPFMNEYEIWRTDGGNIRKLRNVLKQLTDKG